MKKFIVLFVALGMVCFAYGQSEKIKYNGLLQAGVMFTASEPDAQVQTIQGISYKTFALGAGVAIDYYNYKSLPLFIDLRKNIFDEERSPFVYAALGTNLPLEDDFTNQWVKREYEQGKYYDLGAGYKWKMKKDIDFLLSMGYNVKTVVENNEYYSWSTEPQKEEKKYVFRRLVLKVGLRF